jgi:hypothetical protein
MVSGCENSQTEVTPEMRMASVLLSRTNIDEVKLYRDRNYIHGLSFFYFHVSGDDVDRVVTLMKMKEKDSIPSIVSDSVLTASKNTGWKFMWDKPRIYVTFYCHPFDGTNSSVDLLLVSGEYAVFVTNGYLSSGSYITDDTSTCEIVKEGRKT